MLNKKVLCLILIFCSAGGLKAGRGDAFGGALVGSFLGSAVTSAATRSSGGSSEQLERKVRELHDALIKMDKAVANKINEMNVRIEKLGKEIDKLKK